MGMTRGPDRAVWLVAVMWAAAGCAESFPTVGPRPAPSSHAAPPSGRVATGAPRRLVPRSAGAASYESRPAQEAAHQRALFGDPLRQAVQEALRDAGAQNGVQVVPDVRLDEAMTDLARALRPGESVRGEAVEFVLGHHGIIEPYPRMAFVQSQGASTGQIAGALAGRTSFPPGARLVTCGVGIDRDTSLITVLVAMQDKLLDLQPVPRRAAVGATLSLTGELLGAMNAPLLAITDPAGAVHEQRLELQGRRFAAPLHCQRKGRHQVEIFGTDEKGPRVLANFPIYCGQAPPAEWVGAAGFTARSMKPADAQARMLALVNRDRRMAGLGPLALDPELSKVALAHSLDMLTAGFVGHISPTTGGPVDRLRRAGIPQPPRLLENVGAGSSVDDVEEGLMRSPGHRGALLDKKVTRIGIGVAISAREDDGTPILATQMFR
jgi:uncharacterized protein YkwD